MFFFLWFFSVFLLVLVCFVLVFSVFLMVSMVLNLLQTCYFTQTGCFLGEGRPIAVRLKVGLRHGTGLVVYSQ